MTEETVQPPKYRSRWLRASVLMLVGITVTTICAAFWILMYYQVAVHAQAELGLAIIDPAYPLVPLLLGIMLVLVGWRMLPRRVGAWGGD